MLDATFYVIGCKEQPPPGCSSTDNFDISTYRIFGSMHRLWNINWKTWEWEGVGHLPIGDFIENLEIFSTSAHAISHVNSAMKDNATKALIRVELHDTNTKHPSIITTVQFVWCKRRSV